MRLVVPLLLLLTVAAPGCLRDDGQAMVRIEGTVEDAAGRPLPAIIELRLANGTHEQQAGADGSFTFRVAPEPACTLWVRLEGYAQAAHPLSCASDLQVTVGLRKALSLPRGPGGPGAPRGGADATFVVEGVVTDAATGQPVPARVAAQGEAGTTTVTAGADGAYRLALRAGSHTIAASSPCHTPAEHRLDVQGDLTLDIRLAPAAANVPAGAVQVFAAPGPGPGMVTFHWEPADGAVSYRLFLDAAGGDGVLQLGNSLAYGVHAAGPVAAEVAAVSACGGAGPRSEPVTGTPLLGAGAALRQPAAIAPAARQGDVRTYPVLDASLEPSGSRAWRVVPGTGNCCENYIAATPAWDILDLGGETILWSRDNGSSWREVGSPLMLANGEGAVAAAPDGDIVAISWATYNADTLFSFKYSAASGTWLHELVPVHAPVYDRPWIATIKGPFEVEGLVVPYVTVVHGGPIVKEPLLVSLDGLAYRPSSAFAEPFLSQMRLETLEFPQDANRDWIAPLAEFPVAPLDNGLGLYGRSLALDDGLTWSRASLGPTVPPGLLRVDSRGGLHVLDAGDTGATYAVSHDGGATWETLDVRLPGGFGMGEWDFRVHAALDQAVLAVNADGDGEVQQFAFRFRGVSGTPWVDEVLLLGDGGGTFGSGVLERGNRFDFMTVGFLPDGRLVASLGDSTDTAPQLAVEMP